MSTEAPKEFIRFEGFFSPDTTQLLKEQLGNLAVGKLNVEVMPYRDSDDFGMLLEKVPSVGKVITRNSLLSFGRRYFKGPSRASILFTALHGHTRLWHRSAAETQDCNCSLDGGTVNRGRFTWRYIQPVSLVTAYQNGEIENVSLNSYTDSSLIDSVCYQLLEPYIEALTS